MPAGKSIFFVSFESIEDEQVLLDLTLAYPDGIPSFWDFCRGRVRRIIIEVSVREIPAHFCLSSYENDEAYRNEFQSWVGSLWADKDNRLDALLRS